MLSRWLKSLRRSKSREALQGKRRVSVERLEDRTVPAAFTVGNLVIYRVGDGTAGLVNTGSAVFLDEYTPMGTLVQSVPLPGVDPDGAGAQRPLIASGTATSEGLLTRSTDGAYLLVTGYGRDLGGTGSLSATTGAAVNRIVGRVSAAGTIDTSTALADFSDGNNPRSATSTNGSDIWVTGGAGGIRHTTFGGTTSTQLSTTVTNLRQVNIFDGQLSVSTGSGTTVRIGTVGTGTPTTSGQTITNLPGFVTAGSPYGYFLADLDTGVAGVDTLYVASDDAAGLTKYSLVGGNWTANGTIGVAGDAYRGLTAFVSGTTVTLYATRRGGSAAAGGGEYVSLVDTSGYNGAFSGTPALLATAGTNTAFRGIARTPEAAGDTTPPSVTSINRVNANPTNATSVDFTVTFSEPVTGVGTGDFALTTSGVTGASISSVSGSGTTYTVTVNTGSGDGTIRLDVVDDDTIVDATNNPLGGTGTGNGNFTTGQVYTIDKTAPTVVSSNRTNANPTNATSVDYTVTFSEIVTGVNAADFVLATTGVSGASITGVSGTGAVYTVSVNTGTGDGTIRLDVLDDDTIVDGVGNPLGGTFTTGQVYNVDKTVPTVVSSNRANANPTNATSVDFTVTFSEVVTGVNVADFALTTTGVSGASITGVSGTGAVYTVSVNTGTGDGTIRLDVMDDGTIFDAANNPLGGAFTTGQVYSIDKTAPVVVSSNRLDPNPISAAMVQFSVIFSEAVTGVGSADFTLTTSAIVGATITGVSGSGTTYTVTVNTGSGSGTIRLDVLDDDTIVDAVGNSLAGTFTTGQSYTFDRVEPNVLSSNRADPNPTSAASVTFTVTFTEAVTGVDLADFALTTTGVSGASITGVSGTGAVYTVTVSTGSGSGTIRLDVIDDDTILDTVGNPLGGSGTGNGTFLVGQLYHVDRVAPVVVSSNRASGNPTNAASVDFTVTFSEVVTGVNAADFALTTTGVSGASITGVSGTGAVYTVSVNTGTGDGTIRLDVLDDDTIVDAATNPLGGTFTTGQFYTIDKTAPVVVSSNRLDPNPTNAAVVNFTVVISEPVTGVNAADFTLTTTGVTGASVTGVSGSGTTYTVTVNTGSGDGTIRLDVLDDDTIVDAVGNPLGGTFTTGQFYTIDKTAPVVVSSNRADTNPTTAASVNFTVTFSEAVTGVNAADFALTTTGVTGTSITGVSGSGTNYTVTVNTGSGSGTIRLDVLDDDSILDAVNNPLSGGFTTGQSYTLDRTAPDTTITSQPPLTTSNTSATFTFTGSDNVTPSGSLTFQARLDGAPFTSATSPVNFTGLTPGSHTFEVRAIDQLGNVDPTPAVYTWTIVPAVTDDWGDAPDLPFATLAANNGARHTITTLLLGAFIDGEGDGQPNATAIGDGSDEDGVSFLSPFIANLTATVRVTVSGAPSGAKLDAWIDWNHDGDWTDPGEQIATTLSVVNGANDINLSVPTAAQVTSPTTAFARFRLSSAGGLGFIGAAADGEVEDYAVTLLPRTNTAVLDPTTGNLIVTGSDTGNIITINATTPGRVSVSISGKPAFGSPFDMTSAPFNTGRIIVYGLDGMDTIQVIGSRPAELHGGGASDFLYGGSGDDVMYGEVGNDYLSGGGGNDVLIGGAGQDNLLGGSGHDLLIGGSVAPSQTWTQLIAARAAYLGTGTPAVNNENDPLLTALLAAISDTEKDTVTGGSDIDLFFLPPGGPADTTIDPLDRVRS